jgi:hypothetical protein
MGTYTALEIGLEYLPYFDDETEAEAETTETTETTELNNIELPF